MTPSAMSVLILIAATVISRRVLALYVSLSDVVLCSRAVVHF